MKKFRIKQTHNPHHDADVQIVLESMTYHGYACSVDQAEKLWSLHSHLRKGVDWANIAGKYTVNPKTYALIFDLVTPYFEEVA